MLVILFISGFTMIVSFLVYFLTKDDTLEQISVSNFVAAGAKPTTLSGTKKVSVPSKFAQKAKTHHIAQVRGDSARASGLNNNDIVAIDADIKSSELKSKDIIYLKFDNDKDKYKLREFAEIKGDDIYSYTIRNGKKSLSKHPRNNFKGIVSYFTTPIQNPDRKNYDNN